MSLADKVMYLKMSWRDKLIDLKYNFMHFRWRFILKYGIKYKVINVLKRVHRFVCKKYYGFALDPMYQYYTKDTKRKYISEQKQIQEMINAQKYLDYEIEFPIHLEDYVDIDRYNELNPIMYEIVVPIVKEFYYKGQKYRVPDNGYLEHNTHNFAYINQYVKDFDVNMDMATLKKNIKPNCVYQYNFHALGIMKRLYRHDIEFFKENGYLIKVDEE